MKKLALILALLCGAVYAEPAPGAPPTAKTDNAKLTSDELTTTIKERDELKIELATVRAQLQLVIEQAQYYQKLADVNQLGIKLVAAERDQARARVDELQAKLGPSVERAKKEAK